MTIDHAARDFSRPYAASSDEGDRGETGSDRPAIAMTIVASRRGFQPYRRSLAPPCGSSGIIPQPPTLNHIARQRDVYSIDYARLPELRIRRILCLWLMRLIRFFLESCTLHALMSISTNVDKL